MEYQKRGHIDGFIQRKFQKTAPFVRVGIKKAAG